MDKLGVFKSIDLVEEIKDHFKNECASISPIEWSANLISGKYDHIYFKEGNVLFQELELPDVPPSINYKFNTDIHLAIELYDKLNLETLSANDGRLWTYLSLGKYRDYIYNRWKAYESKTINTMLGYFFFTGASASSLSSHPLAQLWWGIHKTKDDHLDDPFQYSKILFSNSQVVFDVVERAAIISDSKLTRSYLEVLEKFPGKLDTVSRNLSPMILNHLSNHSIEHLTKAQIDQLLEKFIEFLKSQRKI